MKALRDLFVNSVLKVSPPCAVCVEPVPSWHLDGLWCWSLQAPHFCLPFVSYFLTIRLSRFLCALIGASAEEFTLFILTLLYLDSPWGNRPPLFSVVCLTSHESHVGPKQHSIEGEPLGCKLFIWIIKSHKMSLEWLGNSDSALFFLSLNWVQNALLPAGMRQKDQTKKAPTGTFQRDSLLAHLEKQAKEHPDKEDLVPYTGEKRGGQRANKPQGSGGQADKLVD